MKKFIGAMLAVIMASGNLVTVTTAEEADAVMTITADKTAQWTAQEKAAGYDLRIHGYKDWETAAYIGFSLPENFTSDDLVNAKLTLYTESATKAGSGYLYSADYSAFTNGEQYEGSDDKPAYTETHIQWIDELPKSGAGEIDITDYIKNNIADNTEKLAFRIDGKSYNTTSSKWIIGSCSYGTAPQLVLTFGEGYIKNYKFKQGTQSWTTSGDVTANTEENYLTLKSKAAVSQKLTGLKSGKYDLHARVKSDNMGNIAYIYAKAKGHPIMKTSVALTTYINDNAWRDVYVQGVNIDQEECEVGLILEQLDPSVVREDPRATPELMPDGQGTVLIDSMELTGDSTSKDVFLTGGDINWLTFLENHAGVNYYDIDGTEKDANQIMAENGANIVRLRLYNDPGKGHGDGADYLLEGYQNPDDILDLARRAKEKGMQIQLTFHYSDYWTNANDQLIPHEWAEDIADIENEEDRFLRIQDLLYDFTYNFMLKMKNQGTLPEYVSFGNEMHTGLLFSRGRKDYDYASTYKWDHLAALLNTAYDAVNEVSGGQTKVILHLDGAGDRSKYNNFFSNCKNHNVNYDVIGISYYPYWYPKYDAESLVGFCDYLIDTFDKDIMFLETGYSFVDKNKIGGQDTRFTDVGPYQNTLGQSQMGQKAFMEEFFSAMKSVKDGRCLGDLYWDPIMIQHEGVGWAYKEADDSLEHNKNISITMFDTQGYENPSQRTFMDNGYIPDTVTIAGHIDGLAEEGYAQLTVNGENYIVHPDRFGDYVQRIPYADTVNVTAQGDTAHRYEVDMTMLSVAEGFDFANTAAVTPEPIEAATPKPASTRRPLSTPKPTPAPDPTGNLLINKGFEEDLLGTGSWRFTNTGGWYSESAQRTSDSAKEGSCGVKMSNGVVAQRVKLEAGKTYKLTGNLKADGAREVYYGFYDGTKDYPSSNAVYETTAALAQSGSWQKAELMFNCEKTQDYVIMFKATTGNTSNTVYVDDTSLKELSDYINIISADIDKGDDEFGVLRYSVDYKTESENPTLYVALYDADGKLKGCVKDIKQGSIIGLEYGDYTMKVFLWNDKNEPVCKAAEETAVYEEVTEAYMFVHFVGEQKSADDEQIYFSVSKDGKNWDILNGDKKILESTVGEKGVRDPYIVRSPEGDKFYLMATDLSIYNRVQQGVTEAVAFNECTRKNNAHPGSNKMVVWESRDLINWSKPSLVQAAPDEANSYWAPECIWDPEQNAFMVFGACRTEDDGLLKLYRSYTTDFKEFTEPQLYMEDTASGVGVFDTTITNDNGKFYRIYKTNRIRIDSADSLSGSWTAVSTNIHSIANNHEGPTICKAGDSWMLMLDSLTGNGGYQPFMSDDLSKGQFTSAASTVLFPNVKYRHGAIMQISGDEYYRLVNKYGINR